MDETIVIEETIIMEKRTTLLAGLLLKLRARIEKYYSKAQNLDLDKKQLEKLKQEREEELATIDSALKIETIWRKKGR